jgi:hypothetical protein
MMMKKQVLAALGALAVGLTFQVQAASVTGAQDKLTNGCVSPIGFFVGQDCSYNGSAPFGFGYPQPFIGPIEGGSFYLPGEAAAGIQKRIGISGDLNIAGVGPGAVLSGTFTVAAGEHVSQCTQTDGCIESWDSVDHVITPKSMFLAAPNSAGGWDYQVSTFGVPAKLDPCVPYFPYLCISPFGSPGFNWAAQVFPSVTPSIPYAGSAWVAKGNHAFTTKEPEFGIGFGPKNIGTTTTATYNNWNCVPDTGVVADCDGAVMQGNTPGIENLQAVVSTNAAGGIIAVTAAVSQEYALLPFFPPSFQPDSWSGNYMDLSGFGVDAGYKDVQIDKKNITPIKIYGTAELDVNTIDSGSLLFGPGEFSLDPVLGSPAHANAHITGNVMTVHMSSEGSDLRCGQDNVKLRGTSGGVPFVLSIGINGVGKACRPVVE